MGLIAGVLQPLYGGFPAVLMAPAAFIQHPIRWLQAISTYRGTTSWAPNFAYELCVRKVAPEEREQLDLRSWRIAGNGAEPVRAETIEHFAHSFAASGFRREAFTPGYGLAEGTLMVSSSALHARPTLLHLEKNALAEHRVVVCGEQSGMTQSFVGCGPGGVDQRVVIVEPATKRLRSSDEVGEIWLAGPSVAQGYWRRAEETAQIFAASLAESGEGSFLRTGDLGFVSQGELFITGRLKDTIIIRGRNHYPQDIELSAEKSHRSLRPGCGAAFTVEVANEERLVLVHELARNYENPIQICQALRRDVALLHELQVYAVVLIRYGSIYKTSSGKIQRRACREAFLRGDLDVIAQDILAEEHGLSDKPEHEHISRTIVAALPEHQQHTNLQKYLQERLSQLLHLPQMRIALDAPINTYGLDSLKAAELQMSLESDLEITLPFTDLLGDFSVSDLVTSILTQLHHSEPDIQRRLVKRDDLSNSPYPLSSAQEQLWFLHQLDPQIAVYNVPIALRLQGFLDKKALEQSIDEIIRRHEIVRATFRLVEGRPVQSIQSDASVQLALIDIRGLLTESERQMEVQRHIQLEEQRPFDLSRDVLLRVTLFLLASGESFLLITMHHILCDGRSIGLFLQELEQLYSAFRREEPVPLPAPPVRYSDYVFWQLDMIQSEAMADHLAYWKRRLDHMAVLDFPTDRARPGVQRYQGATQRFSVSAPLKQRFQELCSQEGATLFMAFLAAFQILLMRYTEQEDIALGTVVANRPRPELANMLGFFANTLVIRSEIVGSESYRNVLRMVRTICLEAYTHQELPFAKLVEELRPARNGSYNPLFQILFSWQPDVLEDIHLADVLLTPYQVDSTTSKFDLSIEVAEGRDTLTAAVVYSTDLFDEATISQLITSYQTLLEAIVARPDLPVAQLTLYRVEQLNTGGLREGAVEQAYVHELFALQAARTPDAVAVACVDSYLTYEQLNHSADQLAFMLRRRGVCAGVSVGVCLPRSLELIVGLFGTLKAGGVYVPLDSAYPAERLALMIHEAHVGMILTRSDTLFLLPAGEVPMLCLDSKEELSTNQPLSPDEKADRGQRLLYIIFTSGSTGQPKGAAVYHHSFVMLLRWFIDEFRMTAQDRTLLVSSFSFDLTQKNLFAPLLAGGTLVLHSAQYYDVALLRRSLLEQAITLLNWTPSAFYPLIEPGDDGRAVNFPGLRSVFLGGEPISVQRLSSWPGMTSTEIVNTYGPTECTDVVAFFRLPVPECFAAANVPIGRAVWRSRLLVLDRELFLLPPGALGELCITGVSVGAGYINDPALTASRFMPDPFSEVAGQRLYRTGDRARCRSDDELEFLGRVDLQVKLNGYRIELGEIEAVLHQHPAIHQCAALVREDIPGNSYLVAYVVLHELPPEQRITSVQLREYLRKKLAPQMLPSQIVMLDAFPLTPSGKLDRQALPRPVSLGQGEISVAPRTPLEQLVAGIWLDVSGLQSVGVHDDFFLVGGHSLLGTQLISRIRLPLLRPQARDADLPLSFAQQRLWFLAQMFPKSASYVTPLVLRLQGPLRLPVLRHCWQAIVQRHEALRTRFVVKNGQAAQKVVQSLSVSWPLIDLATLQGSTQTAILEKLIAEDIRRPFNLVRVPLFRLSLLRLSNEEHMLMITIHHIIFDGWSQNVLLNELSVLYQAFCREEPAPLPELPVQYADFALWQKMWLQGDVYERLLHYWIEQLRGYTPLQMPTDRPRPLVMSDQGASHFFALSPQLSQELAVLSRQEEVTVFMTLLLTYQLLLARWCNQEDIVVGTDIANRTLVEMEPLIGFFINILPLRTKFRGQLQYRKLLKLTREMVLGAFAHQDLPFDKIVDALQLERNTSQLPLINVLFVWQNLPSVHAQADQLVIDPLVVGVNATKFDLALFMWEEQGKLAGAFNYSTDLFDVETVQKLALHFEHLLQSVASSPDAAVEMLEMHTEEEKKQLAVKSAISHENHRNRLRMTKRNVLIL